LRRKIRRRITRRYRPGTLILETEFRTESGSAVLIDFMRPADRAADLVRIVTGRSGQVNFCTEIIIRFDYGMTVPWVSRLDDGGIGRDSTTPGLSAGSHRIWSCRLRSWTDHDSLRESHPQDQATQERRRVADLEVPCEVRPPDEEPDSRAVCEFEGASVHDDPVRPPGQSRRDRGLDRWHRFDVEPTDDADRNGAVAIGRDFAGHPHSLTTPVQRPAPSALRGRLANGSAARPYESHRAREHEEQRPGHQSGLLSLPKVRS